VFLLANLYRDFFRAFSNPTRFAIVQLLRDRPHYVGEIAGNLRLEQSRVSHNLACLLHCGFVEWEWREKNKVYRLNPQLLPILAGIEKHLSRYAPSLNTCQVLEAESQRLPRRPSANRRTTISAGIRARTRTS
jgi:DNA-binding transcriptional ArsR family regulator